MGRDDEEETQGRGFKVSDRRRFVEGADADAEGEAASTRAEPAPPRREPEPEPAPAEPPPPGPEHGPVPEMTFSAFVISLTTQALMHLGEIADPQHPDVGRDLPAAKQMIDLLGILSDKTKGNLDTAEEQLLGDMLYDLRMRYVELSRAG
jgi:hypothetical protein